MYTHGKQLEFLKQAKRVSTLGIGIGIGIELDLNHLWVENLKIGIVLFM